MESIFFAEDKFDMNQKLKFVLTLITSIFSFSLNVFYPIEEDKG